mmetsp:Transcript_63247/g.135912  ORF Transcript_63247/g.135912 Transcript_63247/m.135912 type:complete len:326 (+) Transcript_63247:405-1382(+)
MALGAAPQNLGHRPMGQLHLQDPPLIGILVPITCAVEHPRERGFDPRHPRRIKEWPTEALVLQGPICDLIVEGLVEEDALVVPFGDEWEGSYLSPLTQQRLSPHARRRWYGQRLRNPRRRRHLAQGFCIVEATPRFLLPLASPSAALPRGAVGIGAELHGCFLADDEGLQEATGYNELPLPLRLAADHNLTPLLQGFHEVRARGEAQGLLQEGRLRLSGHGTIGQPCSIGHNGGDILEPHAEEASDAVAHVPAIASGPKGMRFVELQVYGRPVALHPGWMSCVVVQKGALVTHNLECLEAGHHNLGEAQAPVGGRHPPGGAEESC